MSKQMSKQNNNNEEDVMDMLSVSDNFDMTREEECDLLGDDEMAVDSPVKKSTNESTTDRKPIVFDLRESLEEDDENDGEERDKFKTERQTINLKASQKWKELGVPERLDSIKFDKKQRKRLNGKRNRRNRRGFGFGGDGQQNDRQSNHPFKRSGDLRQFINQQKSGSNGSQFINFQTLPSIGIGMTPLMNYQMGLGILDPTAVQNQIQSQLLLNTLLAHNASNPLLNRLSLGGQTSLLNRTVPKPKDDIEITIRNELKVNSSSKCMTKPQIRRQVTNDGSQSSTDCEIVDMPSMPSEAKPKPQLSTLFSKHLQNKANQSNEKQSSCLTTHSSSAFGEALAEVEVGVDNEYLQKLEEQKRKREEWLQQKERNRLEMADERLESALNAKKMIGKY